MLVVLVEESYNFLTGALSNAKTKKMADAKWRSIALTISNLRHRALPKIFKHRSTLSFRLKSVDCVHLAAFHSELFN